MKKIALTGNMGSGKSYVSNCIKRYGVFVQSMDEEARKIRIQYKDELFKMFDVDNEQQFNEVLFNDENKLALLESYLYPKMINQMNTFFKLHIDEKIIVVEVPLLFEKGWQKYFDEVWCVTCSLEVALQRLKENRNISNEDALKRLSLQMNDKEKAEKSDQLLYNNIGDHIDEQIEILMKKENIYVKEG